MEQPNDRPSGWMLGRVVGAPVVLAPSSLVGALLLTVWFAGPLGTVNLGSLALGGAFVVLLYVSVLLHELAHGLVAKARGQQPRAFVLTLLGGHTTFDDATSTPATSALVAVAGPLVNLVLAAGIGWAITLTQPVPPLEILLGEVPTGQAVPMAESILYAAAWANGFIALFNLVPGLPMDGGRVLEAGVWAATGDRARGTFAAGWFGRLVAAGVVAWSVGRPLLTGRRIDLPTTVWAALIAVFLWQGATGAIRYARQTRAVGTLSVARLGRRAIGVPHDLDLAAATQAARLAGTDIVVVLGPDGSPAGYVDGQAVGRVPGDRFAQTAVAAVAVPLPGGVVVDGSAGGDALLAAAGRAAAGGGPMVVVTTAGQVVAVVATSDVAHALGA